jgi:hypothetical protein
MTLVNKPTETERAIVLLTRALRKASVIDLYRLEHSEPMQDLLRDCARTVERIIVLAERLNTEEPKP